MSKLELAEIAYNQYLKEFYYGCDCIPWERASLDGQKGWENIVDKIKTELEIGKLEKKVESLSRQIKEEEKTFTPSAIPLYEKAAEMLLDQLVSANAISRSAMLKLYS